MSAYSFQYCGDGPDGPVGSTTSSSSDAYTQEELDMVIARTSYAYGEEEGVACVCGKRRGDRSWGI